MHTKQLDKTVRVADQFPVWKTVRLGTGPGTAREFRTGIGADGMRLGDWASDILGKRAFTVAREETEVDLVVVSVEELGFRNGAELRDIYAKGDQLGLQLCPAEVGPQLRMQYPDQPRGEWLIVAMEPITASDGYPDVFYVEHDSDGRWLLGDYGSPDRVWHAGSRFVFVRPRNP